MTGTLPVNGDVDSAVTSGATPVGSFGNVSRSVVEDVVVVVVIVVVVVVRVVVAPGEVTGQGNEQLRSRAVERMQTSTPKPWSSVTVTERVSRFGEPGHVSQVVQLPVMTWHTDWQQITSSGPVHRYRL